MFLRGSGLISPGVNPQLIIETKVSLNRFADFVDNAG